jgi:hypothetical protein
MIPFFSFNPLSKMYMFFPDQIMFALYPSHVKTINVTTFYEIFDGFHYVTLKFNFTILIPEGVDPRYLNRLKQANNNTAPCFVYDENIPVPYIPK